MVHTVYDEQKQFVTRVLLYKFKPALTFMIMWSWQVVENLLEEQQKGNSTKYPMPSFGMEEDIAKG